MDKTKKDVEREGAERDEVVEALLHPDRAHHDELGRTEEAAGTPQEHAHPKSSPREQGAAPIDISKTSD